MTKSPRRIRPSVRSATCLGSLGMGVVLMAAGGCMTRDQVYQEIRSSRAQAYRQWSAARRNEEETQARLTGKLSLEDSLTLALANNKPLQTIIQDKEIARGRVIESYSEILPKASVGGAYTRLDEAPSTIVGGGSNSSTSGGTSGAAGGQGTAQAAPVISQPKKTTVGFVDNYSVALAVRQPIFRGGAISAALRAARAFAYLSDEQVRGQVQQTLYDASRAYYDVLLAQHLYEVNRDAVRSAEAQLRDVQRKRGQGVASEFDVLRAQVDVSNFRAEMIQQRNQIHRSRTRLFKTMGVSQESDVTLADVLSYQPMKPVLEEAIRIAYENRPDLYQAEFGVRLQEEAVRIAASRYWPTVDAVFTQNWARPDPHASTSNEWGDAWSAGVVLDWPLFDGLAREGRLIQEKAALTQRTIELLDAQEQTLLDIQQALLDLRDAEEFAESQRLNLARATEGLRLAEVGYREGIHTEVEVTDARAALTRARGLYYQAIYSHTVSRLNLQRAMGILGPLAGDTEVTTTGPVRPADPQVFGPATQPQSSTRPSLDEGDQ